MREGSTTEFKQQYTDNIKNSVTAFANTNGGKIYIGINDDGTVCGVTDTDNTMLRLTNMVRDTIKPDVTMFTECGTEQLEGKAVVTLTVQRGTQRPYYISSKGIRPEGVYVRQGASSVPASETAILNMIRETSGDCYEEARSINQQLTFTEAEKYFTAKETEFTDAQKRSLNIMSPDGTWSNLGMLLSDQCVHTIKIAVFQGSRKSIFLDRREFTGSLLKQLNDSYSFIELNNKTKSEFSGLKRIDKKDYPEEALREALLNAIVHRDYSMSASTLISIFDDRIEFVTVGGLVRGITYNDIMLGVSALRNSHLANIFYRLKLIEAYGTGIMKIKECYEDKTVKPLIEISDNAFKITLPNLNYKEDGPVRVSEPPLQPVLKDYPATEREEKVTELLKEKKYIVRSDVDKALGTSQTTSSLLLRKMTDSGILIKEGKGKASQYKLGK